MIHAGRILKTNNSKNLIKSRWITVLVHNPRAIVQRKKIRRRFFRFVEGTTIETIKPGPPKLSMPWIEDCWEVGPTTWLDITGPWSFGCMRPPRVSLKSHKGGSRGPAGKKGTGERKKLGCGLSLLPLKPKIKIHWICVFDDKWTSEIYASFPGGGQEENMTLAERKILKELFSPHQRDHKAKTLSLQKLLLNKKMKIIQKF